MVDPKRWLEDDDAPREVVRLLRGASRPRAASRAKRMALMGLAAGAASQVPRTAWGLPWLKSALYAGAVVVTGTAIVTVARHQPQDVPREADPVATTAPLVTAFATTTPEPSAVPVEPAAVASSGRRLVASPHAAVRSKPPTDTLAEEEALLEAARRELTHSPRESLKLLQKHQQRFPNGELTAERLFLGTDAAVRLRDTPTAHQMAEALVARFPDSAYARRVPTLLASLPASSSH